MKTCNICGKEFENGRQLGGHKVNTHSTRECEICKKIVFSRSYKNHLNSHRHNDEKVQISAAFKGVCEKCGKEFVGRAKSASGRFCSHKCAHSRIITEEWKASLREKGVLRRTFYEIKCHSCGNIFSTRYKSKKHCNFLCKNKCEKCRIVLSKSLKGKTGGLREKGGRGKSGWYKGYYCQSSWELAYVMYNIDNDIEFSRNTKEKFPYEYEGKQFNYYPDFKIGNTYIEVKGYYTGRVNAKLGSFPKDKKLIVVDRAGITFYLKYAKDKYGENFLDLYSHPADVA